MVEIAHTGKKEENFTFSTETSRSRIWLFHISKGRAQRLKTSHLNLRLFNDSSIRSLVTCTNKLTEKKTKRTGKKTLKNFASRVLSVLYRRRRSRRSETSAKTKNQIWIAKKKKNEKLSFERRKAPLVGGKFRRLGTNFPAPWTEHS